MWRCQNSFASCLIFMFFNLYYIAITKANHNHEIIEIFLDDPSYVSYSLECDEYYYYKVDFPYPCKDLNITLIPTQGDPDVYASKTVLYPSKSDLTWGTKGPTDFTVTVSHWNPNSSPGYYYIAVYNPCFDSKQSTVYQIRARSFVANAEDDLYLNPAIGINQVILANDYQNYRFCIPDCGDLKLTLTNCLSDEECPGKYSYPELLLSRTNTAPTIYSYSYKLAQVVRRYIDVSITDPAARDYHGYLRGTYYVGVYGWCTPDQYVLNNATDGPCSYASQTVYNLTLELFEAPMAECNQSLLVYPKEPSYPLMQEGVNYEGNVTCNSYTYYMIAVDNPCKTLNINLTTLAENDIKVAELAVGKYPNTIPTFDNLEWTSYNFGNQYLTIPVWDNSYVGGYICGINSDSLCYYYIGVYGYCVDNFNVPVTYNLNVQMDRVHVDFNNPRTNQTIVPKGRNDYEFCIHDEKDVSIQILTYTDACTCPTRYSNLEMVVSKDNRDARLSDLVWRITSYDTSTREITLSANDEDVRPGPYYLNVYGTCTADSSCSDSCTCAPCSNLLDASYTLFINYTEAMNTYATNMAMYMPSCGETGDSTCDAVCDDSNGSKLSDTDVKIIIAVVVVAALFLIFAAILYVEWRRRKGHNSYVISSNTDINAGVVVNPTSLELSQIHPDNEAI